MPSAATWPNQVDGHGGVDGDHIVILGNVHRVIHHRKGSEEQVLVVVQKFIQCPGDPKAKPTTVRPGINLGRLLLMTPAFIRAIMESDIISVWQPRSFLDMSP